MTAKLPSRLHHTAYVSKDLEATRHFYEDILGFPLVATWCEQEALFGKERTYCHCFFGLADGSALAFFQFAYPDDQAQFGPELAASPFRHIALNVDKETQDELERRIAEAGFELPQTYVLDHGYCRSVYVVDPDGMIVEFTHDAAHADQINEMRKKDAHSELKRWLAGDHTPNNDVRPDTLASAAA
jgi:catechol 2,3-dioxygenase-like lactoylglutathione lyase family enzyme